MASRKTSGAQRNDALAILTTLHGNDASWDHDVAEATTAAEIAEEIFALRERHQLTQQALASLIGSSQPAIARLESGEYHGHSIAVLRRMAAAVGEQVSFRFVVPAPASRPMSKSEPGTRTMTARELAERKKPSSRSRA